MKILDFRLLIFCLTWIGMSSVALPLDAGASDSVSFNRPLHQPVNAPHGLQLNFRLPSSEEQERKGCDDLSGSNEHAVALNCGEVRLAIFPPPKRAKPRDSRHERWARICGDYPRFYPSYTEMLRALWPGISYLLWILAGIVIAKWFVVYLFLNCPGKAALSLFLWILLQNLLVQSAGNMVYYYCIYGRAGARSTDWGILLSVQLGTLIIEFFFLKWVFSRMNRSGSLPEVPSGRSTLRMILVAYAASVILVPIGMFFFSEEMCVWEQAFVGPIQYLDYQRLGLPR